MAEPTTRLRLKVSPGAARTELAGRHGDAWKVRVSAAPERGRANDAVVRLLEGAMTPVDCVSNRGSCSRSDLCATRQVWSEMKKAIDDTLDSITLQDLVERQEKTAEIEKTGHHV